MSSASFVIKAIASNRTSLEWKLPSKHCFARCIASSSNRTSLEWKPASCAVLEADLASSNRTSLEWKLKPSSFSRFSVTVPSNRTSLEWKLGKNQCLFNERDFPSNRTSLEWKLRTCLIGVPIVLLLIEPVWNGN